MIIRLKGADFSNNNLGQVLVERELTQETQNLLSNYSKSLTAEQKFAVQDFIAGLKSNGIWSYLKNLYLPVLAGNLSETLYNVKTGVKDATPNSIYYTLTAKGGIACIAPNASTIPTNDIVSVRFNGSQQNAHGLVYNAENIPSTMAYNEIPFMGVTSPLVFQLSLRNDGRIEAKLENTNATIVSSVAISKTPTLSGFVSGTEGLKVFNQKKFDANKIVLSTDTTYTDFPLQLFKPTTAVRPSLTSYGLVSFGSALSDEQTIKYGELADNLMRNIGIL